MAASFWLPLRMARRCLRSSRPSLSLKNISLSAGPDMTGWPLFVTEDVIAKFHAWRGRGVHFRHPPQAASWGGIFSSFEDVDGNSFTLVGWDEMSREVEAQHRAITEKLEYERRVAQELEIAKQVQARLFPQTVLSLKTLEYAGICIQAHEVGGDYYDFLDLGRERLGLVIGDISGKGIAAALLMANLQANLRGQCAIALDQPERLLQSANQLFYDNTADSAYATLFFAEYEDKARRLRYANCGHLSALLLRRDQTIERLNSTGTVPVACRGEFVSMLLSDGGYRNTAS